jgi:hypothetical protein
MRRRKRDASPPRPNSLGVLAGIGAVVLGALIAGPGALPVLFGRETGGEVVSLVDAAVDPSVPHDSYRAVIGGASRGLHRDRERRAPAGGLIASAG